MNNYYIPYTPKYKTWCTEIYSYLHGLPNAEKLHSGDLAKYYNI